MSCVNYSGMPLTLVMICDKIMIDQGMIAIRSGHREPRLW